MTPVSFSVVVPTYGRPDGLVRCLQALTGQDIGQTFEVVVVDDGSPEPVAPVVRQFDDRLRMTVLRQPNAGPGAARNAGLAAAGGSHVAFTDDDCLPDPSWLSRLATAAADRPDALLGGRTVNALRRNSCAEASQLVVDYVYSAFPATDPRAFFPSSNVAGAADGLRSIDGFDDRLRTGEDRDLCDRWRASVGPLLAVPEAVVRHEHHLDVAGLCRQHFAYGRGVRKVRRARSEQERPVSVRKPIGYQVRLLARPFAPEVGSECHPVRVSGMVALARAAMVAGFAVEAVDPMETDLRSRL